jgi:hypothetical protein
MTSPRHVRSLLFSTVGGTLLHASLAAACGGGLPAPTTAFPAPGAAAVSPESSIFIGARLPEPQGIEVEENGKVLTLAGFEALGTGSVGALAKGTVGSWSRLRNHLSPGATYVVRATEEGATRELTRFTTAATYDKTPGVAAAPSRLRLWRVHYPLGQVNGGSCVFSEYEGYIDLDYQPGSLPGTPPDEVINVLTLTPKTGGAPQRYAFAGSERVKLARSFDEFGGKGVTDVPDGGVPSPIHSPWKPELMPDREYCLTVTTYGRNDMAILATTSQPVCAPVTSLMAGSAPADGGAPGPEAGPSPADDGPVANNGGATPDAGISGAPASSDGCTIGRGRSGGYLGLALASLALALLRRRARTV